jgi:LacI family transcriptional regulator
LAKSPTVYDVAQAAGVSIATVSFTFSRPSRVKPATREAVLAAARRLGYVPSATARGLAVGRTKSFGLIFWDGITPPPGPFDQANAGLRHFPRWVHEVQYGLERAAWRHGYAIMVGDGDATDVNTTAVDIAGRVDGLVLLPRMLSPETLMRVAERIPVVSVTEGADNPHLNSITVDNHQGMTDLVDHLITAHNIRTAEFVGATETPDYRARFAAFRNTLLAAGLPAPTTPVAPSARALAPLSAAAPAPARDLAVEPAPALGPTALGPTTQDPTTQDPTTQDPTTQDPTTQDPTTQDPTTQGPTTQVPDAYVCRTDADALDLLDELRRNGIRVPEDVIVTGFDGLAAGLISQPTLTTVRQPMYDLGVAAVELLLNRLADPESPTEHRTFPVDLTIRRSCGCPS